MGCSGFGNRPVLSLPGSRYPSQPVFHRFEPCGPGLIAKGAAWSPFVSVGIYFAKPFGHKPKGTNGVGNCVLELHRREGL